MRHFVALALCIIAAVSGGASGGAASGGDVPPRSVAVIRDDILRTQRELSELVPNFIVLTQPDERAKLAPRILPPLKAMYGYVNEFAAAQGDGADPEMIRRAQVERRNYRMVLALFGDPAAIEELKVAAASGDPAVSVPAKASQLAVRWMDRRDAAVHAAVLDEFQQLATAHPASDDVTDMLLEIDRYGANKDLTQRAQAIAEAMTSASAEEWRRGRAAEAKAREEQLQQSKQFLAEAMKREAAQQAAQQATELARIARLKAMEGKPLTLAGPAVDGKSFSTAQWKGKVILVDFWATWCGPCIAELPRLKKFYAEHHDKGFEVLGVSCDSEPAALQAYLKHNSDMPWPQLFDAHHPGWHPLAKQFGIQSIPTMFLIDQHGILRSVDARADYEQQVIKLLAE